MTATGERTVRVVRDAGLQVERTTLAWSRTALSLAGLGVFVARPLAIRFGVWAGIIELAGAAVAGIAMSRAFKRYHRWSVAEAPPTRAGVPNAAVAGAVTVIGLAAVALATTSIAHGAVR